MEIYKGKEMPEPITKRERDELEGITPIEKDALKYGLQTPWDETLEELEFKAADVLPENPPEKIKKGNEVKPANEALHQAFKEHDAFSRSEKEAIDILNNLRKDYFEYFPKDMLNQMLQISPIIDTLISLYNSSSTDETRAVVLKKINELFDVEIYLAQEIYRTVGKRINEKGEEKE